MKTLGALTREYVEGRLARKEIKPTSAKWLRDGLRYFCEAVGKDRSPRSVTREDIEQWMAATAARVSVATYRQWAEAVRLFFAWATLHEHVAKNPFVGIVLPSKPRSVHRGLSDEMVGRALAMARDTRERLMISLEVREGLRAMEVAGLQMADVDLRALTVHVTGKGGHQRVVPLTAETARLITAYVTKERGRRSGCLIQSRLHSVWNDGDGLKPETIVAQVSRAMKRAGVPESGHALRHSYANALVDAGAPVQVVSEALGHASLVTTQIYMKRAHVEQIRKFAGTRSYHPDGLAEPA